MVLELKSTHGYSLAGGDSLQLMKLIPDGGIDCVITDPPYQGFGFTHENYVSAMRPFAKEMLRCAGRNPRIAISQPESRLGKLASIFGATAVIRIPDAFQDKRREAAYFLLRNPMVMDKIESESWSGFAKTNHPNPRDVGKMAVLVKAMSEPGDTILDPFCGSGAIGLAAVMLGRRYLGIELVKSRLDESRGRFEQLGASEIQIMRGERPSCRES